MSGDADHIVRMKVANSMSTLYEAGRVDMSCEQQGAIYLQVTETLQNISSLNVRKACQSVSEVSSVCVCVCVCMCVCVCVCVHSCMHV